MMRLAPLLLVLSCGGKTDEIPPMPANELLTRMSLDLRGVRPTVEEYASLEAEPQLVEQLMESYLEDDRFGERVRSLFSEIYLTRAENYYFDVDDFPQLADVTNSEFLDSIGEESLYVLDEVATNDLPLTELVVADWTMANPITAAIWPVEYPADGTGWQRSRYTDGRPTAGL